MPLIPESRRSAALEALDGVDVSDVWSPERRAALGEVMPLVHTDDLDAALEAVAPDTPDLLQDDQERSAQRRAVLGRILPIVPAAHRGALIEAVEDLDRYNMTQPDRAVQAGVKARLDQWNRTSGKRLGGLNVGRLGLGVAGGAGLGVLVATQLPIPESAASTAYVGAAAVFAVIGAVVGYVSDRLGGYHDAMMRVIVNERETPVHPEMVTGQAEIWIPKVLLAWRAHEWRYTVKDGRPFLWLQLVESTIHESLKTTLDYLFLPDDPYLAKNAAVYAQKGINRMVSDNALDLADVEEGRSGPEDDRLKALAPFLLAAGIVAVGFVVFAMTL